MSKRILPEVGLNKLLQLIKAALDTKASSTDMGNKASLETNNKTSLVEGINEINSQLHTLSGLITDKNVVIERWTEGID